MTVECDWIVRCDVYIRCLVCRPYNFDDDVKYEHRPRRPAADSDGGAFKQPDRISHYEALKLMAFIMAHAHGREINPVEVFCKVVEGRRFSDYVSPTDLLRQIAAEHLLRAAGRQEEKHE
jgi:hypothetical protein